MSRTYNTKSRIVAWRGGDTNERHQSPVNFRSSVPHHFAITFLASRLQKALSSTTPHATHAPTPFRKLPGFGRARSEIWEIATMKKVTM